MTRTRQVFLALAVLLGEALAFQQAVPRSSRRTPVQVRHHPHGMHDSDPPPLVWTSRRGMIQTTTAAFTAPILLQVSGAIEPSNAAESSSSWMADPGPAFTKAAKVLAQEADQAAAKITPEIRTEYNENGVAVIRNVVSQRWITALRNACEDAEDEPGPYAEYLHKPTDQGIFFTDLELARRLPIFAAFSLYGPCAAVAGSVTDSPSILYLYDQLFVKEQGVSTHTPWHQDGGYWRVKGPRVCSVFCPLDPVEANESLAFIKGSHKWNLHNPNHFADGTPYTGTSLPPMPDINAMKDDGQVEALTFDLQPGDVLVFSASTVHGGPGNWGRALSTRWADGGSTKFWARPGEGAIPTGDVGLQDGQLLAQNSAAFPQVWQC